MRQFDQPEDAPEFGKAIPRPKEEPKDREVRPGVYEDKNKRLYTKIPGNNQVK